jgi:transposase
LGLPVICLDARHAQAALSLQLNKTDRNDAHGLAQMVRMGWYRAVAVKSLASHRARALLGVRAQLIGMRTSVSNQMRGILKTFGTFWVKAGALSSSKSKRSPSAVGSSVTPCVRCWRCDAISASSC